MAYIVDLICIMQIIFLLASEGRVTPEIAILALRAYEKPRRVMHLWVDGFDGTLGILPSKRDRVLEEIETLIWRHTITDREIEELRRRIGQVLPWVLRD